MMKLRRDVGVTSICGLASRSAWPSDEALASLRLTRADFGGYLPSPVSGCTRHWPAAGVLTSRRGTDFFLVVLGAWDAGDLEPAETRDPCLSDPEQLTECSLRQAALLPKRPQVLTKLARKVDREVHVPDVLQPIYML